ncbi:hypothetical protein V7x_39200 [Crateriforma conspicua]|uniref:Uncharacterized protein n=1 Tax=Crateriforma conspicua TaxID=2527996 RepID=A0A5C6FQ35_9PLAN|nr:hypothetical protein V7x_39200 [Crateriforma conspicua]
MITRPGDSLLELYHRRQTAHDRRRRSRRCQGVASVYTTMVRTARWRTTTKFARFYNPKRSLNAVSFRTTKPSSFISTYCNGMPRNANAIRTPINAASLRDTYANRASEMAESR